MYMCFQWHQQPYVNLESLLLLLSVVRDNASVFVSAEMKKKIDRTMVSITNITSYIQLLMVLLNMLFRLLKLHLTIWNPGPFELG